MTPYREILKRSWNISWKNKSLWFFGFFASIISFGAELKIFSKAFSQESGLKTINDIGLFIKTGIFSREALQNISHLMRTETSTMLLLSLYLLVILAMTIFFIWLATSSQISIIDAVKKIKKDEQQKISIKEQIKKSKSKFWPVLGMNALIWLIINGITLLISLLLVVILIQNKTYLTLLYGLLFIIFIPIILFISFVIKYAIAYIVIDDKKVSSALKNGWIMFKKNWLISIEMAITLFFINILAMLVVSFASFLIFILFSGIAVTTAIFVFSSQAFFWTLIAIAIIIALVIIALSGAIVNTFQISAWTELFIKLKENKASSKLERIFTEQNK
jgi:membrane-anchored glycerophosphoryl diester phosphodiesterase (GDPDase)